MFGKKKKLGIQPKMRTIEEINQDYNQNAVQAGHKSRVVKEIQAEVDGHLRRMLEINEEAKHLPKAPPPDAIAPAPEPMQAQVEAS